MAKRHVPTFVSCDWDFFVYNGFYDKIRIKNPHTDEWEMAPGVVMFDWGHSEGYGESLQGILWHERMQAFDRCGLRMEEVVAIRTDVGCTHPYKFAEELEKRFDFSGCATLYGDSHAHGHEAAHLSALHHVHGPVDLLLFDAHHDLGYDTLVVGKEEEQGVMSCGSWAYHTLRTGIFRKIRVVYPDWKGKIEWPTFGKMSHLRTLRSRVSCTTWSEWCEETEGKPRERAAGLHHARSSSWTPPYLDLAFSQLVERMGSKPKICMDCESGFGTVGVWDACKQRTWFR